MARWLAGIDKKMKNSLLVSVLVCVLFFAVIHPARAPQGGKKSLGGRTIASVQEEEFDHTLQKYQYCYGLRFSSENATQERRRSCKAIFVHKVEEILSRKPGSYFKEPMDFQCQDTAFSPQRKNANLDNWIFLRPNQELAVLENVLSANVVSIEVAPGLEERAKDVCDFMVDCKAAMRKLSARKIASCFTESNSYKRRVMLDSLGQIIFHGKADRARLIPELLHGD